MKIPQHPHSTAEALNRNGEQTTIANFPSELLLIIFENLNLREFNIIAKSNQFYGRIALTAFKHTFGNKSLIINENGIYIETQQKQRASDYGAVKSGDMDVMYSTLKLFGHLITKLIINYKHFRSWECGQVNARISKYLGTSLIEITLWKFNSIHFKNFIGPFEKVQILTIDECFIYSNDINLPNVFPSLRNLQFTYDEKLRFSLFEHHFAHLEEINELSYQGDVERIKTLLQLNPQLRKLKIQYITWEFLKKLSNLLPQLERLEIAVLSAQNSFNELEIHFENLRTLKLWSLRDLPSNVPIIPLKFSDKFEELIDWTLGPHLLNFISRNKHLKKLFTQNHEFLRIAEELPHLEEFRTDFSIYTTTNIEKVVQFLGVAKNLKQMKLKSYCAGSSDAILQRVSNEWEQGNGDSEFNTVFIRRQ